jgi:hypothetical protein
MARGESIPAMVNIPLSPAVSRLKSPIPSMRSKVAINAPAARPRCRPGGRAHSPVATPSAERSLRPPLRDYIWKTNIESKPARDLPGDSLGLAGQGSQRNLRILCLTGPQPIIKRATSVSLVGIVL